MTNINDKFSLTRFRQMLPRVNNISSCSELTNKNYYQQIYFTSSFRFNCLFLRQKMTAFIDKSMCQHKIMDEHTHEQTEHVCLD
jgi:hypothetical protein